MLDDFAETMRALAALQSRVTEASRRSDWFGGRTASRGANPPINIFEKDHDIVVLAEIPGADKSDFEIYVERDVLRITGRRATERPAGASAHRLERRSFDFDRSITLPFAIDADSVTAEYHDGILAILCPREKAHRPRAVAVS